ncbi:MAG: hypothetical protein H6744_01340 [Deltaproteobacteria bacterium]|nr:hypothetical protein [Deltaproteobacteria bacterium]
MEPTSDDAVREITGMLVRVIVGGKAFPGAIREREGRRIRVSTEAPLRLRGQVRVALIDTDPQMGTVQFGARVSSIVAGGREPEAWLELGRVVAAADVAFFARLVELLVGRTPTSWLAFRRNGPWTSYDLDPTLSSTLPSVFERLEPPAPPGSDAPAAVAVDEPPRPIPRHLLEDCRGCALPVLVDIGGETRRATIHRASRDGGRVFLHLPGDPPRLGDAATLRSGDLRLTATVGWVDRTAALAETTECALLLGSRIPTETRAEWRRQLDEAP